MGTPEIRFEDAFPIDDIMKETAALRQVQRRLDQTFNALAHPHLDGIEKVDAPEQLKALREWVDREEKVRALAVSDYTNGINPTWPPTPEQLKSVPYR